MFFCGAGVSYPAGLPDFKGLVSQIYRLCGTKPQPIEQEALRDFRFDAALDLLERRLPGGRLDCRRALATALKPKLRRSGATATHQALLDLGRCRDGALRLVTTNFDRVFEAAARRSGDRLATYAAPMLPVPKNSRWNGLVYLHGVLPTRQNTDALNRLVVTSGDFGLAYLTERWAARFVGELFRNYIVCFVGYSLNDPVLRYMVDALAADRMLGEQTPEAWVIAGCEPGGEAAKEVEWAAKGVKPILYAIKRRVDHSALHRTLHEWADTHRDGTNGKERIVVTYARARPAASTRQDDFVGRMLWALSDAGALPAKRFADHDPVAPLEWLFEAFCDERFRNEDLGRFGIPALTDDPKLKFCLVSRPAPYALAPWMRLVCGGLSETRLDEVLLHLSRWLARHLDDVRLVLWFADHGGRLNDHLARLIENTIDELARKEREGEAAEIARIRAQAPNAVPTAPMRTLWRLLLTGRVRTPWQRSDVYTWMERVVRDGLTPSLRIDLRQALAPRVKLSKRFKWDDDPDEPAMEAFEVGQLLNAEVVLASDHPRSALADSRVKQWRAMLPSLLSEFEQLLRDALDLQKELGQGDSQHDRSHWALPSISEHWQNRHFADWAFLIELVRDAWLATFEDSFTTATHIALAWFHQPYPTFKRLALFAATHDSHIVPAVWAEWLILDDARWLWSSNVHRELMRLLAVRGAELREPEKALLEEAILRGPRRTDYPEDIEPDRWAYIVNRSVWLRLAKLEGGGLRLGPTASSHLSSLRESNPTWKFESHQREEFLQWMSGTGDPDYEESRDVDIAPKRGSDLLAWLKQSAPSGRPFYESTWQEVCRTRFFASVWALLQLSKEENWPVGRWREALQAWGEPGAVARAWRFAAPLLRQMPNATFSELIHGIAWWLHAVSKSVDHNGPLLLALCERVLDVPTSASTAITENGKPIERPVTEAINHPVGLVTQALLNHWFKDTLNDNDGVRRDLEPLLTRLCDRRIDRFIHGRVLLASRLITLYRIDPAWTTSRLVPLFDWALRPPESRAAWEGFLWSPRIYPPLLLLMKRVFLETAQHYAELGEHAEQYAALLTFAALGGLEGFSNEDFRTAFEHLPQDGLRRAAQALSQAIEGAADKRQEYWSTRAVPFWRDVWPKARDRGSPAIAESLARAAIAAGSEFPSAVEAIQHWLQPIEHPYYVVHQLQAAGACKEHPEHSLKLLAALVAEHPWPLPDLAKCVAQIKEAAPYLVRRRDFQRLHELIRRTGSDRSP